ncbi:hypothetical protein MBRA1_002939 [Malassezia brasiliensis]|uniref:Uncharacterized protein n=1 Tax=Malassezia brasiliensis TaxID=1821822 RepID=A0AAF0DVP8_9BASI|nr:hypothetical protein MBRA1_002939 [Malassezia brasiliensis]
MRGRGRSAASASRWKGIDVLAHIEKSKHTGQPRVMRGGVARLSTGSDDNAMNEDDTLYVWHDADLLPNGAVMISARKATFDERWPYTGRRGWRPTSNKVCVPLTQLAEAGFHFTPGSGEDDGCTCIYCGVELGGWERSDDPIRQQADDHSSDDESREGGEEDGSDDAYVPDHKAVESDAAGAASAEETPAALETHAPSPPAQADDDASDAPTTHDHADDVPAPPEADDTSKSARLSSAGVSVVETLLDEPETAVAPDAVEAAPKVSSPKPAPAPAANDVSSTSESSSRVPPVRPTRARAASKAKARAPSPPAADDDSDKEVEQMSDLRVAHPDMPRIDDYLPIPFPHKHTSHEPPQPPNPDKVTVVEWIRAQQTYLLDTMRERVEQRLASIRARNLQERKRLEKKLRSQ